jgi:predicted DCC family thiol-disulfide oxidoreductase YuxK
MRLLRRLDWFDCFTLVPITQSSDPSLPEALRGKDLQAALHVLTADGRVYSGAEAFRFMGLRLPLMTLPALALFLPGMLPFAALVYRWLSANRHSLSRWLGFAQTHDL